MSFNQNKFTINSTKLSCFQIVGATVALAVGGVGGVVGYSSVDADFRKMVEETVPGSDQVLDLIIGEKVSAAPPKTLPPPPSKLKINSPVVVTKPKEAHWSW